MASINDVLARNRAEQNTDTPRGERSTQSGQSPGVALQTTQFAVQTFRSSLATKYDTRTDRAAFEQQLLDPPTYNSKQAVDADGNPIIPGRGKDVASWGCPLFSPGLRRSGQRKGETPSLYWYAIVEHDGGTVGFDTAVAALQKAGIDAIVYTSSSHTPEAPRWRVVVPLQAACNVSAFLAHLDTLNGVLGGVCSPECAQPKRSWFFGRVKATAEHFRSARTKGAPLDTLTGLPSTPFPPPPGKAKVAPRARGSVPVPVSLERIAAACAFLDPNDYPYFVRGKVSWLTFIYGIRYEAEQVGDIEAGREIAHRFSSRFCQRNGYNEVETDLQYDYADSEHENPITGASIIAEARRVARETGRVFVDPLHVPNAEGFEVVVDEVDEVDERTRLVEVFGRGAQTDADRASLARLSAEARSAVIAGLEVFASDENVKDARDVHANPGATVFESLLDRDFDMNDAGNVAVLIALHDGDLRYDASTSEFMFWHNSRWERDEHGTLMREAIKRVERYWSVKSQRTRARVDGAAQRETAEGVKSTGGRKRMDGLIPGGAAAALDDLADKQAGWAKACGNVKQINAIRSLAATEGAIVVTSDTLDRDPYLLGVENGVVDLRTGQLRADARDEFVTRRVPVAFNPDAKAPRWERFQQEICGLPLGRAADGSHPYTERPALVAYKRRWAGSMLIGENVGQKFFTATGEGSNGKSLELESYIEIMGPLAVKLPGGAFIAGARGPRDADAASPTLASLRGARLALASETEAGSTLNTGDVKAVTGDEQITARMLHSNGGTFHLEATPVLLTNHPPNLKTVDNAIVGRIAIVPYDRTWNRPDEATPDPERPDADAGLKATLRAEREGILAWMVRGAAEVLAAGGKLNPPEEVTGRTDDYLREQTAYGRWLGTLEQCDRTEGMKTSELLEALRAYARSNGLPLPREASNDTVFGAAFGRYAERVGAVRDTRTKKWGLRPARPTGLEVM